MPIPSPSALLPHSSASSSAPSKDTESPHRENNPRLARSPHPYHRRSIDLTNRVLSTSTSYLDNARSPLSPQQSSYFPSSGRRRSHTPGSASDSGTEADDERPLLRALTAPPLKPRKGLKSSRGKDDLPGSPLLTPSAVDEERRLRTKSERGTRRVVDGTDIRARETLRRHQAAERIRRVVEVGLVGTTGFLAVKRWNVDVGKELLRHVGVLSSVYAGYIFYVLWRQRRRWMSSPMTLAECLHFPAAADPAPILYPVLLPLFVVLSLEALEPRRLLVNYVLSLCSIPQQAVPYGGIYTHWLITLIPISYNVWGVTGMGSAEASKWLMDDRALVSLLFPLHQSLLPCVRFLTTTSLLPAELQILTVGLINLLLFSKSPQAVILKTLLWMGGLFLFVFCRYILKWSVELARVPSWRFRRPNHNAIEGNVIVRAIDDTVGGYLGKWIASKKEKKIEDSDDDIPGSFEILRHGSSKKLRQNGSKRDPLAGIRVRAVDDIDHHRLPEKSRSDDTRPKTGTRSRRHTLPTSPSALQDLPQLARSATLNATLALSKLRKRSRLYLSLTKAQATVIKWLYASYIYFITIASILVPIRIYIGRKALNDYEPVGWALGYLFGDVQSFRLETVLWNLENWITLPPRDPALCSHPSVGERLRQRVIGAANTRLLICTYCVGVITLGLTIVFRLSAIAEVDTRRKVFHGMMVAMFLPTTFIDPCFVSLALVLVLAIFLLLDLFRASTLPPLAKPLTHFLAPYVDGRDHRGPVIVSHIFLLIGCAVPLWLSLAASPRIDTIGPLAGWDVPAADLSMVAGIICVGMGDAAASLIGRRYGRRRWIWSGGKSLEGSVAFAVAVVVGLLVARAWLVVGGWDGGASDRSIGGWIGAAWKASFAAAGASLTEAVLTGGNDNVVVPVVLWLLTKGLGM